MLIEIVKNCYLDAKQIIGICKEIACEETNNFFVTFQERITIFNFPENVDKELYIKYLVNNVNAAKSNNVLYGMFDDYDEYVNALS